MVVGGELLSVELIASSLLILFVSGVCCSFSKNPFIATIGGLIIFLMAIGSSAVTVFLWNVGTENNWTSDGPGMLLVMIAFGVSALISVACWMGAASILLGRILAHFNNPGTP